jgi:uncharacterized protein
MNEFYIPAKTRKEAWYKEPWLLFVMAGPFIVVIAGFVTLYIAWHGSDKVLSKDYYKQGLNINKTIEQDARADELRIQGTMQFIPQTGKLTFNLDTKTRLPDTLLLRISTNYHAAEFETVQKITLTHANAGVFEGMLKTAIPANIDVWHVILESTDWRLTGDWVDPYRQPIKLKPQN